MQRRKYPEQTALPGARSLSLDRVREDLTKVSKENNLELFQEFKKHDDVANQVIRSLFPNRKLFSVEEKIFDQDDQVQIQLSRIYPYHAVAQLRLLFPEDNYIGTGWLAGPKTLITVGHNLFDSDERQAGSSPSWANSVEISPVGLKSNFLATARISARMECTSQKCGSKTHLREAKI